MKKLLPFNTCVQVTEGFYSNLKGYIKGVVSFSSSYKILAWDEVEGQWTNISVYYENVKQIDRKELK